MKIIGITGTNGKTSTCHIIYDALTKMGKLTTYIGTLGIIDRDYKLELDNTTPEIDVLAREIDKAKKRGCKYIVMEVSSHALSLNRVNLLDFNIIGFTNLSQDHLDYYGNMEKYFYSKKMLFDNASKNSIAIINSDDIYSSKIINDYKGNVINYGRQGKYKYEIINSSLDGVNFNFDGCNITSKLLFETNIYNLCMAYLVLKSLGINKDKICDVISQSGIVNGRCEVIHNKDFYIILDYAHTPDAMEKILLEVNKIKENRIVTLFGCGGNRDKKKRGIMGYIASINSDKVYITNDNPRNEDEDHIIRDILSISNDPNKVVVIKDRKKAIKEAVDNLDKGDVLLILGKGHEDYQIIGNTKYNLSDREIVRECLRD
jgi:UDP-N-acetylmuramoyl-L-alanyl-D-glutamate--2,6-diaminopimelate ligase